MEISKVEKKAIIKNELRGLCQQIYRLSVSARVWKDIDESRIDQLVKEQEKLQMAKDNLEKMLCELDN